MAVMLRKQRDGMPRPNWYAEYKDANGNRKIINTGVKWTGTPPASGSLRDPGDAAFERSREKAEAVLESHRDETKRKGNAVHLVEKLIEAKTGRAVQYTRIDELAAKWRGLARTDPVKENHLQQCDAVFSNLAGFIRECNAAAVHLYEVTEEDAAAWLAFMQGRYSRKTCRDYYGLARAAFGRFLPVGYSNPFPKLASKRNDNAGETIHRKPFTAAELQALLDTARKDAFLFPLVTCAVCTGLRRGDVCALRWDAVDLENNELTVKTSKTGETVSIPIFEPLRLVLEAETRGRSPYVFPTARRMLTENPTGLTWRFKRLIAEALGGKSKAATPPRLTITPGEDAAIRAQYGSGERTERILECYRMHLAGHGYKTIAKKTGLPLGTAGDYVRRGIKAAGRSNAREPGGIGEAAVDALTRVPRENGMNAASVRDWHALRTTWVTLALMAGVEMEVVRSVTGHRTVEIVTRHYFKPKREDFRAALAGALPEVLTGRKAAPLALPPADELTALAAKVAAGNATKKDKARFRMLAAKV